MKIVAVVFDMDGVLFDTERIGVQCWTEAAEPTGLQNAREIARMCIGRTIPGTKEVFMEEAAKQGVALDFEKLHEDCARLILEKEERDGLPVKPGVHEILEYLYERKIPVALAKRTSCSVIWRKPGSRNISGRSSLAIWSATASLPRISTSKPVRSWRQHRRMSSPSRILLMGSVPPPQRDCIRSWYRISCSLPRRFSCWLRQSATACWRSESYCRRSICKYQRVSKSIKAYIRELSI